MIEVSVRACVHVCACVHMYMHVCAMYVYVRFVLLPC